MKIKPAYLIGGAVALALLYVAIKGPGSIGRSIGGGAVDLVTGLFSGVSNALPDVPDQIDPTSTDNLIYGGFNAVGGWITRDDDWTLGGQIYDWVNE